MANIKFNSGKIKAHISDMVISSHQAFIGIGSNLVAEGFATLHQSLSAAVLELGCPELSIVAQSSWYATSAVPVSDQPDYLNAVLAIRTVFEAEQLLDHLQTIEQRFGRKRSVPNAARTLDLDILAFDDAIFATSRLDIPHPRMASRKFVLYPLAEIAPDWRHPVLSMSAHELRQACDKIDDGSQKCQLFS